MGRAMLRTRHERRPAGLSSRAVGGRLYPARPCTGGSYGVETVTSRLTAGDGPVFAPGGQYQPIPAFAQAPRCRDAQESLMMYQPAGGGASRLAQMITAPGAISSQTHYSRAASAPASRSGRFSQMQS